MPIPRRRLAWLLLVNILCHLPYNATRATIQVVMFRDAHSETEIGVVSAVFALPMLLFLPWTGRWIDQVGIRRAFRMAMAFLALGLIAQLTFAAPSSFYTAAALIGAGYSIWYVAINAYIGLQSTTVERLNNFSNLSLSFAVSSLLSGLLVGSLDLHGWRPVTLVLLLGVFSCALIDAICFNELREVPSPLASRVPTGGPATRYNGKRSPVLLSLYVAMALVGIAWDTILFSLPFVTHSTGSTRLFGMCLSVFAASTVFSRLCIVKLVARATVPARIVGCLATVAGGLFVIGVGIRGPGLAIAVGVCGMGLGLIKPCIYDAICAHSSSASMASNLSVVPWLLAFSAVMVPSLIGWFSGLLSVLVLHMALSGMTLMVAVSIHRWCRPAPRLFET